MMVAWAVFTNVIKFEEILFRGDIVHEFTNQFDDIDIYQHTLITNGR